VPAWIPAVVVIDAAGKIIGATDDTVKLTRRTTPAELLAILERWAPKKIERTLASVTEHGARVDFTLDRGSNGRLWLAARFSPLESDAHVYSKDLPPKGIDGMGRPTRFDLMELAGVSATGAVTADRVVIDDRIDVLNLTFPIYPDGPVTMRHPIALAAGSGPARVEAAVGYLVCGRKGCLAPVEGKRVTLTLR